jgi:hypothetical protein
MLKLFLIKMEKKSMKQKLFNVGIILSYLTGAMIVINNIIYYIKYIRGTITDITSMGVGNLDFFGAAMFVLPSLGTLGGVTLLVLTFFGLQKKLVWTWFLYLIVMIMSPLPVLISQLLFHLFPFSIFTVILGFAGVAFTGPHVFSDEKN